MHVVSPARYQPPAQPKRKRPVVRMGLVFVIILLGINYARPLPTPVATVGVRIPPVSVNDGVAWPTGGQAAVAAKGYGLLGTMGAQTPIATASIAKVITALCVLEKQPLRSGHSGPSYTVSSADVALYNHYVAENGSNLPVVNGETLTEYQAIQALMIPSANNIADSLARWVFDGHDAYAAYANQYVERHGMNSTHIGSDASGFDASTTSTASDLTTLGLLALNQPVLMEIAGQTEATFPVAGTLHNYNTVLGHDGITGLKTGNNDADPGAFLFTTTAQVGTAKVLVTGAVLGASSLPSALNLSKALSSSVAQNFEQTTLLTTGEQVGTVRTAWGGAVPIVLKQNLSLVRWKTNPITETHTVKVHTGAQTVGAIKLTSSSAHSASDLVLSKPLVGPSFWWRLTRH